jgi:pimeloyl-ACP methyl ester carboxylesterase
MRAKGLIGTAALLGSAVAAYSIHRMFRHDMADLAADLDAGSELVCTDFGWVEYGREGHGAPVLVIHGAGGGYDQGLFVGRELFGSGHDLIAPSRFGYLRTDLPEAHGNCVQAEAHAQLLDRLKVGKAVVLGISAGAPSAIELALRHPERVSALILVVPRTYAPGVEVSAEKTAANRPILEMIMQGRDFPFWLATKAAQSRRRLLRFLGVPGDVYDQADPLERDRLDWIARNVLPLSRRVQGLLNDGALKVGPWPLDRIEAPTLVVSAADDLFNTLPAARFTAEHIPGAELMVVATGGHLLAGRTEEIRARIARFLCSRLATPRKAAA